MLELIKSSAGTPRPAEHCAHPRCPVEKILKTLLFAVPALFIALILYTIAPFGAGKPLRGPESGLVFYNGTIITVDRDKPTAEAVAIKEDRILYVGSLDEAIRKLGPAARRIDLKGKTLIPGFNDNHTHAFAGSTYHDAPRLWGKSCKEIARIVREEARRKKPGEIITGNSWDYPTCPKPHKSMLDEAAPDNPVFLYQYSGHAAWVNSRAPCRRAVTVR
ncbi:MAG TPA: hypothetical protein ENN21_03835 [Spirochaetes bacterium]|nr:hypothetical protein [Spirochaetota bacterium]